MLLSKLPAANVLPSGEKDSDSIRLSAPLDDRSNFQSSLPVAVSHKWTCFLVPTASVLPSGEKAADVVGCACSSVWSCVPLAVSPTCSIPLDPLDTAS